MALNHERRKQVKLTPTTSNATTTTGLDVLGGLALDMLGVPPPSRPRDQLGGAQASPPSRRDELRSRPRDELGGLVDARTVMQALTDHHPTLLNARNLAKMLNINIKVIKAAKKKLSLWRRYCHVRPRCWHDFLTNCVDPTLFDDNCRLSRGIMWKGVYASQKKLQWVPVENFEDAALKGIGCV